MVELVVLNGCRTLRLTRGFNTLIDEEDFDLVGRVKWCVRKGKRTHYAARAKNIGKKFVSYQMHRILLDAEVGSEVDHKNGDGLDNRRSNLRIVTSQANAMNRHRCVGKSRFKGIAPAGNSWRAYISVERKKVHLGCFASQEEAARAYDAAALKHYGEFACTNAEIHGDY